MTRALQAGIFARRLGAPRGRHLAGVSAVTGDRPAVSPDGRWLAITVGVAIVRVSTRTGHATLLIHDLAVNFAPAFSPDGRWLTFTSARSGANEISTVRANGTDRRRVTHTPRGVDEAFGSSVRSSFSPDGRRLVFESRHGGRDGLYVAIADGGDAMRLAHGDGATNPFWGRTPAPGAAASC